MATSDLLPKAQTRLKNFLSITGKSSPGMKLAYRGFQQVYLFDLPVKLFA